MSSIWNLVIGFITTGIVVLAIVFVFNKFTAGGVAGLGREPISATVTGTK